ncbi:hypothetical protein MJO28_013126 [Puccinia striiformis f. sp. tritici]|uniref:Uncharacterized protein n=1 Tax=Puccinia striiformis f. sp. tritici TaxID=168172 RepID=A0ACC0DXN2_9BASI|nr:hypothetical protein MJO28_013126 [Puccinia striiformis f. sp. tritici]
MVEAQNCDKEKESQSNTGSLSFVEGHPTVGASGTSVMRERKAFQILLVFITWFEENSYARATIRDTSRPSLLVFK